MTNGIIGTYIFTFSALDTFLLIDYGFAFYKADSSLGTYALTGVSQTTHAGIRHLIAILRTGVTCRGDNLHQRGLVIFLIDITLLQTLGQMPGLLTVFRSQAHTHGQSDSLTDDGPVTIYTLPEFGFIIINYFIRKCLHIIL